MMITKQDKQDFMEMGLALALFVAALYMICIYVSFAMDIKLEHARHLVGSVVTVLFLSYILRELITVYWKIMLGFCSVVLLFGAYGMSTEIYIDHYTTLGMGVLPDSYSWFYFWNDFLHRVLYSLSREN